MRGRPLCTVCVSMLIIVWLMLGTGGGAGSKEPGTAFRLQGIQPANKDTVCVTGKVYKIEQHSDYQVLYLKDNSINFQQHSIKKPGFIIYSKQKKRVKLGNDIRAKGEISFFDSATNPGGFDQELYNRTQKMYAMAWCDSFYVTNASFWRVRNKLAGIRKGFETRFKEVAGEEKGGILCAMILGNKSGMDAETKEIYQKNGIGHILAISGLHLSFIGVGVYQFLRKQSGSFLAGGFVGILFLSLYIVMIGVTVSAVRALVMFLLRVLADMTGRVYDGLTSLSVAAAVVVIWRPLSFFDGGAQLSFGSVLGILLFLPMFPEKREKCGGCIKQVMFTVGRSFLPGIAVYLVIFPVLLYHFFEFPLYASLLNVIVVPLMPAILFLGILGGVCGCLFTPLSVVCIRICGWILEFYELLCTVAGRLPFARIIIGRPERWQIICYYGLLLLAWVLFRGHKNRRAWLCIAAGTGALLLGGLFAGRPELETVMLDVGQGDSIFLRTKKGLTCLVDGGSSDVKQVGRYRLEPYLKSRGIQKLDYVFVSHGDADHINGIVELIERRDIGIQIRCLVLPVQKVWEEELQKLAKAARKKGVKVAVMNAGQQIKSGRTVITCLQPGEEYQGEAGNAASLVLKISCGSFDMLLTGDVEGAGEQLLMKQMEDKYEVLKVAHHGSKNSSQEGFLEAAAPKNALISAGAGNRYGHPHKETVDRLLNMGCRIYETKECGAITVKTDGNRMRMSTFCKE